MTGHSPQPGRGPEKGDRRVTVCLPARDEEATVGVIVATIVGTLGGRHGLVDEVLVVDDGSSDATAAVARAAGARVIATEGPGKGAAMQAGLAEAAGDLIVYCDADVRRFRAGYVTTLVEPLLANDDLTFAKAFYRRPYGAVEGEGGRVTELVAKPLLRTLVPSLAGFAQPLAGECASRREVLESVPFVRGYGVDIALLIDVAARFGVDTMVQVDLGRREHRNRPLADLGPQAEAILRTVLARTGRGEPVCELAPLAGEEGATPTVLVAETRALARVSAIKTVIAHS